MVINSRQCHVWEKKCKISSTWKFPVRVESIFILGSDTLPVTPCSMGNLSSTRTCLAFSIGFSSREDNPRQLKTYGGGLRAQPTTVFKTKSLQRTLFSSQEVRALTEFSADGLPEATVHTSWKILSSLSSSMLRSQSESTGFQLERMEEQLRGLNFGHWSGPPS